MTEFDKKLIEKANKFSRWDYRAINVLIAIADTDEAKDSLGNIQKELYELALESI